MEGKLKKGQRKVKRRLEEYLHIRKEAKPYVLRMTRENNRTNIHKNFNELFFFLQIKKE
jgi:hypothetical protein